MTSNDISALVEAFKTDLEAAIRKDMLDRLRGVMGGDIPIPFAGKRGPGRPRGSMNKPKRGRPARVDTSGLSEKLLAHVKANPGQRGEQIAAALRSDVGTMRGPMKKLIAARQVRTEGQRRGMKYFAGAGAAGPGKAAAPKRGQKRGKRGRKGKATLRGAGRPARAQRNSVLIPAPTAKAARGAKVVMEATRVLMNSMTAGQAA